MPEESLTIHASLASGDEATVRIDGRSDLFSAGMDAAHAERGGVLPAAIELAPGGGYITLVSVRGKVGCGPGQTSSPDGGSCAGGSTNLEGASGLSGIVNRNHSQFLGGVFLGPETPEPPPALDFSEGAKGESFAELQPKLGQTFFIGDGLTGTGTGERQRFHIPDGATTLYLGYADGYNFQGKPSYYADNTGGLSVTLTHSPAGEDETGD